MSIEELAAKLARPDRPVPDILALAMMEHGMSMVGLAKAIDLALASPPTDPDQHVRLRTVGDEVVEIGEPSS